MSPAVLRRARWWYGGVGLSCGRAHVRYCPGQVACRHPHPRAEATRTTIRGVSALLSGPGPR